jgi:hypothetical protein
MNLLDKYLSEIEKHLPRKNRLDLLAEIRSTIEDMIEDRSRQTGRPVDEALTYDVIAEYGSPASVAAAYKPARYLIGPRMFPFFEMVIKIVFSVLTVLALIGLGIQLARTDFSSTALLTVLGKNGLQYLTGMISAFGNIVLVFAVLERVLPASEFEEKPEAWSPDELESEPDPNQVKRSELIFESLFIMLGLALFNLYPGLIGIAMVKDGAWEFIPLLSEAFFRYLPWINLLGLLRILLNLYLLRQGIWQTGSRLFNLVVEGAGIVLACIMLIGPSLVSINAERMAEIFGEASGTISAVFTAAPRFVLVILIIVQSVEMLQRVWRLINRRNAGNVGLLK